MSKRWNLKIMRSKSWPECHVRLDRFRGPYGYEVYAVGFGGHVITALKDCRRQAERHLRDAQDALALVDAEIDEEAGC